MPTDPVGTSTTGDRPSRASRAKANVAARPASATVTVATALVVVAKRLGLDLSAEEAIILVGAGTVIANELRSVLQRS